MAGVRCSEWFERWQKAKSERRSVGRERGAPVPYRRSRESHDETRSWGCKQDASEVFGERPPSHGVLAQALDRPVGDGVGSLRPDVRRLAVFGVIALSIQTSTAGSGLKNNGRECSPWSRRS